MFQTNFKINFMLYFLICISIGYFANLNINNMNSCNVIPLSNYEFSYMTYFVLSVDILNHHKH